MSRRRLWGMRRCFLLEGCGGEDGAALVGFNVRVGRRWRVLWWHFVETDMSVTSTAIITQDLMDLKLLMLPPFTLAPKVACIHSRASRWSSSTAK